MGTWSKAGYDPNAPRVGMGWSNEVVAAAVPKPGTGTKTTVMWATTETMKHVGFIAADAEVNLVVPLRDPRTRTMSYYLWRKWRYQEAARPGTVALLDYYEKGVKKLNNMLERFVNREHKAGVLLYLHSTMLEDQDLVLRQFADMLGMRRLVDTDQAYDDLVARIWDQLPEALEVPNATSAERLRRRHHRSRRRRSRRLAEDGAAGATGVSSAHSRLGKVRNEDALEEVRSMCEWAGKTTVEKMDKFLYADGSMTFKYAAALFPLPASTHCKDGGVLDMDDAGEAPKNAGAGSAADARPDFQAVTHPHALAHSAPDRGGGGGEGSAAWVQYSAVVGVVGAVAVAVQFFRRRSAH